MKAVVFEQFRGPLAVRQVPDPAPPADGVVIRVQANGICRSDWHAWMGHDPGVTLPHVPGHELAGVIEAVGPDVRRWQPGDRVTVPFAVGCGQCPPCQRGHLHLCDDQFQPGFTAWGSFAQYVAIPRADLNLIGLPAGLDFVEAASLGCRLVTAHRAVVTQGRLQAGQWLAVHGCGGVGLSAIMIARVLGARALAIDVSADALALAGQLGAEAVLEARTERDLIGAIHELTGGGAHVSLDALGSPETCRHSVLSLRKRGRHVQVGLLLADHRDTPLPMDRVVAHELEVYGSHGMPAPDYAPLLEWIRDGRLQPRQLVARTVTLQESIAALTSMGAAPAAGVTVIDRF